MPGYEAILVDLQDDRTETFRCRGCKLLLRDPVQVIETGLHYCQACIPAGITKHFKDKALWKEVMNKKVYCSNRVTGCPWSDLLRHYEAHVATCQFPPKPSDADPLKQKVQKLEKYTRKLEDELSRSMLHGQNAEIIPIPIGEAASLNVLSSVPDEVNGKVWPNWSPTEEEVIPKDFRSVLPAAVTPDVAADTNHSEASGTDSPRSTSIDESLQASASGLLERNKQLKGKLNCQDKDIQSVYKHVHAGAFRNMLHSEENHVEPQKVDTNNYYWGMLYPVDTDIPPPKYRYRWRIPDVAKMISYAHSHPNKPLDSPWWCTHRGGYRMQACMYLNGNGRCTGTHVSVFVQVLLGPDDCLLRWPLTGIFTVILVDQEKKTHPIARTVRFDPASSSFQRPTDSEMNIARGCPDFASTDKLFDGRYVKDDTMFLEISFDPYERF